MAEKYTRYTLRLSVLSPLHIGSGVTLLKDYDFAVHNSITWRINDSALLDSQVDVDPAHAEILARTPPAQLLKSSDFRESNPFFRYWLRGVPRSQQAGAEVQEQLKDVFDRPYLPGTSVKGALRTALAWQAWQDLRLKPDPGRLGQRRAWAAQNYEKEIFGANPNQDFLRALHVEDSQPASMDSLALVNVGVLNRGGIMGAPIELEAVRGDTVFQTAVKLDWALYSDWAKKRGLQLSGKAWLGKLAEIANRHARHQIESELSWFRNIPNGKRGADFYQQLQRANLSENSFLLQLGWGTGWGDKTFGSNLQVDQAFMEHILRTYRMAHGKRKPGDPFPKSRRVVVRAPSEGSNQADIPLFPLGWVLVEMQEIGRD